MTFFQDLIFEIAISGLCYAEFGARVPKAGSAYVYTYVTVGEIVAFIIGWNLILEYVIGKIQAKFFSIFFSHFFWLGAATVARTASGYIDDLIGDKLVVWFKEHLSIETAVLAEYVDLVALAIVLVLTGKLKPKVIFYQCSIHAHFSAFVTWRQRIGLGNKNFHWSKFIYPRLHYYHRLFQRRPSELEDSS